MVAQASSTPSTCRQILHLGLHHYRGCIHQHRLQFLHPKRHRCGTGACSRTSLLNLGLSTTPSTGPDVLTGNRRPGPARRACRGMTPLRRGWQRHAAGRPRGRQHHGRAYGDDELRGNLNGDTIYGGAGSDVIYGQFRLLLQPLLAAVSLTRFSCGNQDGTGSGANGRWPRICWWGQTGNERSGGGDGFDLIRGGADRRPCLYGRGSGRHALIGGIGNDTVYGDDGNDRLDGNDGDDLLEGGAGSGTTSSAAKGGYASGWRGQRPHLCRNKATT